MLLNCADLFLIRFGLAMLYPSLIGNLSKSILVSPQPSYPRYAPSHNSPRSAIIQSSRSLGLGWDFQKYFMKSMHICGRNLISIYCRIR